MKKFNFKKILSLAMALVVAFGTLAVGSVTANAATNKYYYYPPTPAWTGTEYGVYVWSDNGDEGTVTKVTSSNTSVIKVVKEKWDGKTYYFLKAKKAGTSYITVTYKKASGKKATIKKKVRAKKYPYEIKSLKVNGKKVKVSNNKFYYNTKVSKSKTKLNIKMALKSGWKIVSVYADRSKTGKSFSTFKVTKSALLNGKAIKFPTKYKYCYISVELKKGDDYISYAFDFNR